MKFATTALAIVFLAQAAPALAQREEIERQEPVEMPRAERTYEAPVSAPPLGPSRDEGFRNDGPRGDRPRDDVEGRLGRDAPTPPNATDAAQPPSAPQVRDGGGRRGGWVPGDSVGRPGPWTPTAGQGDGGRDQGNARRDEPRGDSGSRGGNRGDDRRTRDGRGDHDTWRNDGTRGRDRGHDDRRDRDRHDWDRRDGDRRDWDRRNHNDRYSYWQRGRYPSVYFSSSRYRYAWRPPTGYYAYNWGFGDFLPRSWFGPGAFLIDPWRYDLPLPPPGYDWVRAGYDALLVDAYSGRVVQVVRNVFW